MIAKDEAKALRAALDKLGLVIGMGWDTQSIALGWVLGRVGYKPNAVALSSEIDQAMPPRYSKRMREALATATSSQVKDGDGG